MSIGIYKIYIHADQAIITAEIVLYEKITNEGKTKVTNTLSDHVIVNCIQNQYKQ